MTLAPTADLPNLADPPRTVLVACNSSAAVESPLPPLTRTAKWTLWTFAGLFLLCVALRLNGSSIACGRDNAWADLILKDAPSGLLLSQPRMIRSDEWLVWTPAILSQASQQPAFPTTNVSLGPGKTPLLMSIPARHYTMLLRPQLWGYFVLPVEYGFAWNWDCKIFGLLAAMFLFFWTVTAGKFGLSLFGALCVLFSPLVQWWFSSPSMLPEMMTYWALGVTAALHLLIRRRGFAALPAVLALAVSSANIMLCCYPPFEIVLCHLGAFIVIGYGWQHRCLRWRGGGFCLAAVGLGGLLVLPWFLDCYATLQVVAHTVYPGQRQCFGGTLPAVRLFAGFFGLELTEFNAPAALFNACEAGSFYPLWLLPLGLGAAGFVGVLGRNPGLLWEWLTVRGLKVMLAAYLLVFTLFALVPFPPWLCRATLLSRIIEVRGLAGIGLASALLIILSLAGAPKARASAKAALIAGAVWSAAILAFLWSQQGALATAANGDPFLTSSMLLRVAGAAMAFGFIYLLVPVRWAMVALVAPFIIKTALINPVCVGLPELLRSPALNAVHAATQADPQAQWAFYNSLFGAEALKSTGAPVVNGARIIPDHALIRLLDPSGKNADAFNRYSHIIFDQEHFVPNGTVRLVGKVFCVLEITASDLRGLFPRLKYIAAIQARPDIEAAGFHLWRRWPQDHLWIYRLAEQPAPLPPAAAQPALPPAS